MATGDITHLLMPMFGGSKDEYGKDVVPPDPLLFDRVNEGRLPLSRSALFKLPLEILGMVLQTSRDILQLNGLPYPGNADCGLLQQYLPTSSLPTLALVSPDCRQLARSRQFCSVQFDYSNSTLGIIRQLLQEGRERAANGGSTLTPSLGACIRRVQIATNSSFIVRRHNIALDEKFMALEPDTRQRMLDDASAIFYDLYMPAIETVIASKAVLPHLELLDSEDISLFPPSFFNGLACSTIRHLKLFRTGIRNDFELQSSQWPLQTLHLEVVASLDLRSMTTTSRLCISILRACSSTLRSLTWESMDETRFSFGTAVPRFDKLLHARFEGCLLVDSTVLKALIRDGLETLALHIDDRSTADFFKSRGTVPSLKTLVVPFLKELESLDFVMANPQLSKFNVSYDGAANLIESQLLPNLSKSFSNLTSLGLVWSENSISETALRHISSLSTLQQLHLSAGHRFGWRHDWLIDHILMRKHLSRLQGLHKLAFSRDTYVRDAQLAQVHAGQHHFEVEHYYELKLLPDDVKNDNLETVYDDSGDYDKAAGDRLWEEWHRDCVLEEAQEYKNILPRLTWLYFGQIQMHVPHGQASVEPLHPERDDSLMILLTTFGMGED
ncbi:hypothetical protein G7Y79_00037g073360 [Physcia stellaris]|nr:hypothetical protein G7Y79_00037g073360 [Physcia stellaris]